jgi:hypothetical protein
MTLLREIQAAAVDSTVNLPDLLRKCKILASRLGSAELKAWVDHELNGYPDVDSLPAYRVLEVQSYGNFAGGLGAQLKNVPIPPACIPKEYRALITHHRIQTPISSLTELFRGGGQENFVARWQPNLIAAVGTGIYEHMACLAAWKDIPRGSIAAIIDTIRTKILSFVLEIEAAAPGAGEAPANTHPVPAQQLLRIIDQQIFNTPKVGSEVE